MFREFASSLSKKFRSFFSERKDTLRDIFDTGVVVVIYGLILNIIMWGLFGWSFSTRHVLGLGFLFYFVKYEVKEIVDYYRRRY